MTETVTYSAANTLAELQALAEAAGLETSGTKAEIIARLDAFYQASTEEAGSEATSETAEAEASYAKAHILTMARYKSRVDALNALLDASQTYTHTQVAAVLAGFFGGN